LIRIGTRVSALALAQARWVASRIDGAELVEVTTAGDRGEQIEDKSRWTSELERALLEGEIDLAVHSAKDVPVELASGTTIVAVPRREDPHDVLCGASSLQSLAQGARVGTSSLRRVAQLLARRQDLRIVELRGNVDTRLRKLAGGEADAIILAAAGLNRLGRADAIGGVLEELIPAPGQGALILQSRDGDQATRLLQVQIGNAGAAALMAERTLARVLGASCNTPLGALADNGDGGEPLHEDHLRLRGWVGLPDGSRWISDELIGSPEEAGMEMAQRMLDAGADEILEQAEEMAQA
jgi:hydroxymethylbilane synthase